MTNLTEERGWWLNEDEFVENGELVDIHYVDNETNETITIRDAEVLGYNHDTDETIIITDSGEYSYYDTSIFLVS